MFFPVQLATCAYYFLQAIVARIVFLCLDQGPETLDLNHASCRSISLSCWFSVILVHGILKLPGVAVRLVLTCWLHIAHK